jgi:predicted adenine nucleotide alpha hydrolase (AANH) superfamily ATPase
VLRVVVLWWNTSSKKVRKEEERERGRKNMPRHKYFLPSFSSLSPLLPPSLLTSSPPWLTPLTGFNLTIFFYNPNIHPRREYEIRKEENKRYALAHQIPFVDCDHDPEAWFERTKGLEYEPERGTRCTECFDMRMEVTAWYAQIHGFHYFTTTNATSRWKDVRQVNEAGLRAARGYPDTRFLVYNWQTNEMTLRKYEISARERFYKQEYCGCSYSLRDSNLWRKSQGIPPVRIGGEVAGLGTRYFEDPAVDAAEESEEVVAQFFEEAKTQFGNEVLKERYEGRRRDAENIENNTW